jgi:hypothetical protein
MAQVFWQAAAICFAGLVSSARGSNIPDNLLPEQYQLCKTDQEIQILQQTHGLI